MYGGGIKEDFKNAFNNPNGAHIQLIIINVVVFVVLGLIGVFADFSLGRGTLDVSREYFGLPMHLNELLSRFWTPITYMFVHDGFFHILFNMLFLYWFGRILTEYLGGAKVTNIYILGGLAGGVIYLTLYPVILQLLNPGMDISAISPNLVGASAGVFAVVFGTAALVPNYTMFLLFIGPVKIKYIALFYVLSFLLQLSGSNAGGELAHIGGALVGFLYIKQLQKGNDLGAWIGSTLRFFKSFFIKQPNIKVTYKRSASKRSTKDRAAAPRASGRTSSPMTSQEEIDAILDKISERGYESLTKEEKQKLFNASKK